MSWFDHRSDLESSIAERVWRDPASRTLLTKDPRALYEMYVEGALLPETVRVQVLQETPNKIYVRMPARSRAESLPAPFAIPSTRDQFESNLAVEFHRDAAFRRRLCQQSKATYLARLRRINPHAKLPDALQIEVVEESDELVYLRIPVAPGSGPRPVEGEF